MPGLPLLQAQLLEKARLELLGGLKNLHGGWEKRACRGGAWFRRATIGLNWAHSLT
jgi:hypothetical protein